MFCYGVLQLTDNSGNQGNYFSDGSLVDTSPPIAGTVIDGEKEDLEYQRETNILLASWSGFVENETFIHHYELAFRSNATSTDIQPFINVGLVNSAASSNLLIRELKTGVRYYAHVIAYNILGLPSKRMVSSGVLVDGTPPMFSSPTVDGPTSSVDIDHSNNVGSLSAAWKCKDDESGLDKVYVGFGTQPGSEDILLFQPVLPFQTSFTSNNVSLSHGQRYYAVVKCINKVGLLSSSSSDGLVTDLTPPLSQFVHDGLSVYKDALFIGLTSSVDANWKFVDPESGIVSISVSLKDKGNGSTIVGPKRIRGEQNFIKLDVFDNVKHGGFYYFSVTATNGVELNTTTESDGFIVDATPPICSVVHDTTLDGSWTKFTGQVTKLAVYFECDDSETDISHYLFAIKDTATSKFLLPFHKIKGVSQASSLVVVDGSGRHVLRLKNGGRYQVGIRATNKVNLSTEYWTEGIVVDLTPPVFHNVVSRFNTTTESIEVTWHVRDKESKIKSLSWSLDVFPDIENPTNFTELLKNVTQIQIAGDMLQQGKTYYVYLRAINNAGLSSMHVSDGVVIDYTPPLPGKVSFDFVVPISYDGNPNFTDGASLPVKWTGFMDLESGIRTYKWAVGLSKETTRTLGNNLYTEIRSTGTLNGFVIKNYTIYNNNTYYVCIRATNGAGLYTTSCSEGVLVKLGKLTAGVVYDGSLAADIDFQLDNRAVRAHWEGFEDPVFGLKSYEWCYGPKNNDDATKTSCVTTNITVSPPLKSSAHRFNNVLLNHGQRYGVKVFASNQEDNIVSADSDGFTVDRTPPSAGAITIAGSYGARTIYFTEMAAPTLSWTMNEKESAIKEFEVNIGSLPYSNEFFSSPKLSGVLRAVNLDEMNLTITHGMSFFVTVTGKNILGLMTSMVSAQVIVDWTPPIPGQVRDGNKSIDIDYQASTDHLMATWSEFLDPESNVVEYLYCIGTRPGKKSTNN